MLPIDESLLVQQRPYPIPTAPTGGVITIERVVEEHHRSANTDHERAWNKDQPCEHDHRSSQRAQGYELDRQQVEGKIPRQLHDHIFHYQQEHTAAEKEPGKVAF